MTTKELGNLGEKLACEYLVKNGFKILGRNYRITFGEIDIIVKKKWRLFGEKEKKIHFVEVKTIVDNNFGFFPEGHVDYRKSRKLMQLAQIWFKNNNYPQDFPCQIDIIGILIKEPTNSARLSYFPNAVQDSPS